MPTFLELDKSNSFNAKYTYSRAVPIKEVVKTDYVYKPTKLRAVEQVPVAGTLVTPGTEIIVYFEDTDLMPMDIYEGAHVGYAGKTAKEVIDIVKNNDAVKKIIEKKEKSVDLTLEDEVIMGTFFAEGLGLEMNEGDPTKSKKAAYDVIVAAYDLMK
ncbi:MAG: hypothetical protein ABR512_07920 [Desulfopila sp.]